MAPKRRRSVSRKRTRLAVMEGAAAANEPPPALLDLDLDLDADMALMTKDMPDVDRLTPMVGLPDAKVARLTEYMTEHMPGVNVNLLAPIVGAGAGDYKISIRSLKGLDAAIAAVEGPITGTIHAIVHPTATVHECVALLDASRAGSYNGIRFRMAEDDFVLEAKLSQRDLLFDAQVNVCAADRSLSSDLFNFNEGPRVPERQGARTPQARARATLGAEQWKRDVDGARKELHQIVASARAQLQAITARLNTVSFPF